MRIVVLGAGHVGLLLKLVERELEQTVHREVIVPIRVNRRVVDEKAVRSAIVFVLLYLLTFAVGRARARRRRPPRRRGPGRLRGVRRGRRVPG